MEPVNPDDAARAGRAAARMPLIDALKGIAAQLILLHHLACYGPLAKAANRMLPALSGVLFDYGRMLVQVFLVVGGFLAARALAADGRPSPRNPLALVWRRYLRLAPPFVVAMLLALGVALLAEHWMDDEAIPEITDLRQLIAHGLLLHDILDVPSLSAGVWYVAIDLQLYAMLALLMALAARCGERSATAAMALVAVLGGASLFHFNHDASLDDWGIYFFGSYALGAFAWWLGGRRWHSCLLAVPALVVVSALVVDFRLRIALALAVAAVLALAHRQGWLLRWPRSVLLGFLGRISFSVFLLHFPIFLLVSALYVRLGGGGDGVALAAMFLAWALSIAVGAFFHRHVERRARWLPVPLAVRLRALVSARRA